MEKMRDELRQALSTLGPRGRGKPYPKGLMGSYGSLPEAARTTHWKRWRQKVLMNAIRARLSLSARGASSGNSSVPK